MVEPWSLEWVTALDEAARGDETLRRAAVGRHVVIGQEVVSDGHRHQWHIVLDDGNVSVRPGPADAADVTFSQDAEAALAVSGGEMAASTAFVLGHIRVGGDVSVLVELAPALTGLGDVFATVRNGEDGG